MWLLFHIIVVETGDMQLKSFVWLFIKKLKRIGVGSDKFVCLKVN